MIIKMRGLMCLALMTFVVLIAASVPANRVEAATKYITAGEFVKLVVIEVSILKGIKVKPNVIKKYFNVNQSAKEAEDIIEKALSLYYQSNLK